MAADLNLLIPALRDPIIEVLAECKKRGHDVRPFYTLRTPSEQARLWRQSRSSEQVALQVTHLKEVGAHWLAHVLESQPPTHGKWATNALPGQSWHQHGEAVDCFVVVQGVANWDDNHPGYVTYALLSKDKGLTPGRYWKSTPDVPHVQYRKESSPLHSFTWPQIEDAMKQRFPDA